MGLLTFETCLEVELKAETWFPDFKLGICGPTGFALARVLPELVDVNSKRQQKLFQGDFETTRQAEQLVNAGDRPTFDIAQSGMRNVEIRIAFDVGNRSTDSFDIARLNGSF